MTDQFVLLYGGRILASGRVQEIRSLMNQFPHRITIRCDDPHRLGRAVVAELPLDGIEIDGPRGEFTVLTRAPSAFYQGLPAVVLQTGLQVASWCRPTDKLEAVFHYLLAGDR